jgi:paraquat-inducible protein B
MNKKQDKAYTSNSDQVEIVPRQGISIIWFVPFIALIFGLWLTIKVVSEQGSLITIKFDNGSGIVANKTEVRYKGLITGLVKKVAPSSDLNHVIASVEMSKDFTDYLTENTQFWLVSADISLQGVSGLETLISGSYINILPDISNSADSKDEFTALSEAPALDMATPGLHLTLETDVLGSIGENSPISFKQIPIGYVTGYHYIESRKKIAINLFIEPEHAHLVKENSLFYNTSGVQVTASLSAGLKVNTDSLAAIMAGGIAVDTLSYQKDLSPAKNGQVFPLHPDFQSAEMGHDIELTLDWNSGIDHNAAILYQGLTIGVIESFSKIDPVSRKITAKAKVNPRVAPYLTEQSQFYIVAPQLGLAGVSNAKTLLTGAFISIRPSLKGKPSDHFNVFNSKPPYKYSEPGLHLMLNANNRNSLQVGSEVYYKQQKVGNIQAIETLAPAKHLIHIHIQPEYSHYVINSSHFYNNSGLKIKANLQGVDIQAQSLQSILTGGISFTNIEQPKAAINSQVRNGDKFKLFANDKLAKHRASFTLDTKITTEVDSNTRILYRGVEVGAIHHIDYSGEYKLLTLGLLPEYEHILKDQSQFWLVKPNLSLSGATDTNALLGGAYITFNVGEGKSRSAFNLLPNPPAKHASAKGLQLTLLSEHASVATPGSAISYRGITIGQVDNVSLDKINDKILVNITIDEEHQTLVQQNSRFYNAGGVTISGGLSNFVVKTESMDAILRGGISFYNPAAVKDDNTSNVNELAQFNLFKHAELAKNAGLAITIQFDNPSGLKANSKLVYQEQEMGVIERLLFNENQPGATAFVLLNDLGAKYAKVGSHFWKVEPVIGLVGSKNVGALLDGAFITLAPSNDYFINKNKLAPQTAFTALAHEPITKTLPYGLNVKLTTSRLGSIRVGNPILYRQVKVGKVIGIGLADNADSVNVYINIAKRYAPLVKSNSKFWNTSGISIKAGLFSGVDIDSESIETLISGGIAFATPALDDNHSAANDNSPSLKPGINNWPNSFSIYQDVDSDWLTWQTIIPLAK